MIEFGTQRVRYQQNSINNPNAERIISFTRFCIHQIYQTLYELHSTNRFQIQFAHRSLQIRIYPQIAHNEMMTLFYNMKFNKILQNKLPYEI